MIKGTKKNNKVLGIDIDQDYIKIAELGSVPEGIKINSFGLMRTPPDSTKEGVLKNPGVIADAILSIISKNGMQAKEAIISIRSPYALLRLERLPFMAGDQIHMALQKEVNQYTAFQGKEPIFDDCVVEEISEEGVRKINVLFAVANKVLCNSYLKAAELAGLKLLAIGISQLSALRTLNRTNLKVSGLEATMLVEINLSSIDICILKGDKIRFCHTVKVDSNIIAKDIYEFVDKVVSALKLVLNFYQAKYASGEEISKIILACDSQSCSVLKEKLQQRLGTLSIEIGDPVGDMIINKSNISADKAKEIIYYTCAVGSALHAEGLGDYPVRFNLIPKEKIERLELTKLISFLNIILGGVLGIFFILATTLFINNGNLEHQIYELQQQFKKPDPVFIEVKSIFEQKYNIEKETENRLLFLAKLSSSTVPWDRALANAMAKVAENLWLVGISGEGGGIKINGRAYSEEPIFKFVKSLDDSFYFTSAKLVSSQNIKVGDEKEEVEFTIVCNLRNRE